MLNYVSYSPDDYKNMILEFFQTEDLNDALKLDKPVEMIHELADGATDIYNADLWKWAGEHGSEYVEKFTVEFGPEAVSDRIKTGRLEALFMAAQFLQHEENLFEAWEDLKKENQPCPDCAGTLSTHTRPSCNQ